MAQNTEIQMLAAVDNHYVPMLAALIKSIECNLDPAYTLNYWVIGNGLTQSNKLRLECSVNVSKTKVNWVDGQKLASQQLPFPTDESTYPSTIFFRYYFPYFLPADIDRVLYMDVDMINCRNLAELWCTSLDGKVAAAVQDYRISTFDCAWGGIRNYLDLGFKATTPYLNSGVLLIDVAQWRDASLTQRVFQSVRTYSKYAIYPDQYGLNITIADTWKQLNPNWNFFASITHNVTPYNIHFIDRKPMYASYRGNPEFRQEFFKYLRQTQWADIQPIGELSRYVKKISNILPKMEFFVRNRLGSSF